MNDFERRLRDLGERTRDDVKDPLRPRPAALRRIRRRRAVLSTGALACVASVVAVTAFVFSADTQETTRVRPADGPPVVEPDACAIPFEPTYVPEGFDRVAKAAADEGRPELMATFASERPGVIEVTKSAAFVQTRPRPIEVLGVAGTIGLIHEGYSVEFHHGECEYVLNGYGVTKSELRRFATRLTSPLAEMPPGPPPVVVWPEDTLEQAEDACAAAAPRERTAPALVARFATDVLGWESPIYEAPPSRSDPWTVIPFARDTYGGNVEAGVTIWTKEVAPGCWSISGVSRLPDRRGTGVGVSVRGRVVEIGYGELGATSASIEVGYGGRSRDVYDRRELGFVRVNLGYRPRTTGHFSILLRDEDGNVFTAYVVKLPEGDFTAG